MQIKEAFALAEKEQSKIPHDYINKLTGLSSPKIWHLLNNLCSDVETYFEVGTYLGSSLMAATYGNNVRATAVDNFCMKPTLRNHFYQNVKHLKNLHFIEKDCFKIDPVTLPKIDVYFFDGRHEYEDQYKALTHFLPAMKKEFIFIVDDWNNEPVRRGTYDAIKHLKLDVLECEERQGSYMKDKAGWWCGVIAFRLENMHYYEYEKQN